MYIWVAIDIDSQLSKQKEIAKMIEEEIGFKESNISSLPMHISLKISSEVSSKHEMDLREDIRRFLESTSQFIVEIDRVEKNGNIVWIKMKDNNELKYLHNELCSICSRYGIVPHEFDNSFVYHSTLFLDSDLDKINDAFERIKGIELMDKVVANKFVIGSSKEGLIGTYKVDTIIETK